jgi:hypothetical protein
MENRNIYEVMAEYSRLAKRLGLQRVEINKTLAEVQKCESYEEAVKAIRKATRELTA